MPPHHNPEQILDTALNAISAGPDWRPVLDELPVPIYPTDQAGRVTYWNEACVAFAGRQPSLDHDHWCVTWQLFTTNGDPLPHADCPMAVAIKQKKPVRNAIAIALRPDGSRVAFRAYPTPLFDDQGLLTGAVNMLADVSHEQAKALQAQAEHCRRLADSTFDQKTTRVLGDMAEGFDRTARELKENRPA
jgi:PAS domain-containing protein